MGNGMNVEEKILELDKKIESNYNEIVSNMAKLHKHEEKINRNTGAIEVLHTIKTYNNRFFAMWVLTFIALLISVLFNIFG